MKNNFLALLFSMALMSVTVSVTHASPINLAPGGIASQSSNGSWGWVAGPWLANDDNTNMSYYGGGSVAHTLNDYQPWWEVDLLASYSLSQVVLWNRSDGGASWLTNFDVTIADENHNTVWTQNFYGAGGYPYPTLTIDLPENIFGEFVKVQRLDQGYLMLAEVQVFGETAALPVPEPGTFFLFGAGLLGLIFLTKKKAFELSKVL
ncbi:discoidin domain-containing protein [Colwellia sp. MB3u-70]|uniref:galactose-binding domain-containing protein n=1 Tax=unclassified Colwellia TaxID=196834 RepID=UPI0015F3EAF1|nr:MULTISPECIES: discoidin domain-containing protein [unclassified Colwellia]MBA6293674.1 discoidin domain-containing protein [Colwellia sp. MB3u-8]MBA6308900.1 discoidin domain-containing protein [Colwellia sp. MB3u-70]